MQDDIHFGRVTLALAPALPRPAGTGACQRYPQALLCYVLVLFTRISYVGLCRIRTVLPFFVLSCSLTTMRGRLSFSGPVRRSRREFRLPRRASDGSRSRLIPTSSLAARPLLSRSRRRSGWRGLNRTAGSFRAMIVSQRISRL